MFPNKLDGAAVLYHTSQGDYGFNFFPNGSAADQYHYLAICKYAEDDKYYLFCCDENYEVVNDSLHNNIDECMATALQYKENIVWNKMQ